MGSSSTLGFAWSRSLEPLAFWMRTTGTALYAVERRSLARVPMAAQDGCAVRG
jgi:hypothetical protein